jgi:hypothetical protein
MENTLFEALEAEWNMIPYFVIENFVLSFHATCVICYRIEGESQNGHWNEVRQVHHPDTQTSVADETAHNFF